jgi:hypothetical protein
VGGLAAQKTGMSSNEGGTMRSRPIRLIVLAASIAMMLAPAPSNAGILTSSCTTAVVSNTQAGCTVPLAGPNVSVSIEIFGNFTTSSTGLVIAGIAVGDSTLPIQFTLAHCVAQGSFTTTSPLKCYSGFYTVEQLAPAAVIPAGAPMGCFGYAQANVRIEPSNFAYLHN